MKGIKMSVCGLAAAAIALVLIQACAMGSVTDPQGTWIVSTLPSPSWPDTKYVITGTKLDIYWTGIAVSGTIHITPGAPNNGRITGTVTDVHLTADTVGTKWYLIYSRSGDTLNLTWATPDWKDPGNTTIVFTLQ